MIGNVAKLSIGNNINRILLIYSGLCLLLFHSAFSSFQKEQIFMSIFFGISGSYLIYGIFSSLNNSATPIIERNKIKLKKAIFGLTCSRFEVLFENDNGKVKKRIIMLPGSMMKVQNETERAIRIMKVEKLLTI